MRRTGLAIACALIVSIVSPGTRAATGDVSQLPGLDACVSHDGTGALCEDGTALDFATSVAVSPDGTSVYVTSLSSNAIAVFDRDPVTGALDQKPGAAGCLSSTDAACTPVRGLGSPVDVVVSPDGRSVYAVGWTGAIGVFDRDAANGELTQKPGKRGCISDDGSVGECRDGRALAFLFGVAISQDGRSVYVTATTSDAIAVFDRKRKGPAVGALVQKKGKSGCISDVADDNGCADGFGLDGPREVTVSPDGRSVYLSSFENGTLTVFDRTPSGRKRGKLQQKSAPEGCVAATDLGGECTVATAMGVGSGINGLVVSPDNENLYFTGSSAVLIFDRLPTTGEIDQKSGADGCISASVAGCSPGTAIASPGDVAVSADGLSAYVVSFGSDALAIFDRNEATGVLTQKPGTAGCISDTGSGGTCVDGVALDGGIAVEVSPSDTHLYSTTVVSDAVAAFAREPAP